MKTKTTQPTMTLCLAHDVSTNRPQCPHANQCQRNLALRERDYPAESTITGSACSSNDYLLFLPAEVSK